MDDIAEHLDGPPKKKVKVPDKSTSNDLEVAKNHSTKMMDSLIQDIRKRLKEENALQAVHALLDAAKKNTEEDVIHNYIKAGGGPLELLKVLQSCDNKKNLSYICPIFSTVHLVIMKIISDFPHLEQSAEEACCYLLHECTPVLHSMMSSKSSMENKKLVLCLLTAVASLSFRLSRDVLTSFSFEYKSVEHLAEQVNPSDPNSVRVRFIHFLIAFMIEGNSLLIKQLLQNKGLLRLVLKDMVYDNCSTVELFLTTLREKIVMNNSVQKTTKLHSFNTSVLINLIELYSWLGPKSWKSKRQFAENSGKVEFKGQDEEREKIRLCTHELLILLCTSHKQGIVFEDKLLGTGQCQNTAIRSLFKNIEMAWNDDLVRDLTLQILTANPDLMKPALASIKLFFEPSSTPAWMSTCKFLKKLVETVQIDTRFLNDLSLQHYTRVVMSHSMPPVAMQYICNIKSLKFPDPAVRYACLTYLVTCLEKLQFCIKYFKDNSLHNISPVVSRYLNKVAPKFEWLLSAWMMKNASKEEEDSIFPIPPLNDYLTSVIDATLLLHSINPEFLYLEDTENIDEILVSSFEKSDSSSFGALELKVIRVVSILKPLNPMNESFSMALHLHINLLNKPETKYEARKGLEKLLLNTGCLDNAENEVEIWLHCLETFGSDCSLENFFLEIVRQTITNIGSYFKCLVEAYDEVTAFQGKSTSNIDEVFGMLENDVESKDRIHSQMKHSQNISPLVPAMLDVLNSQKHNVDSVLLHFSSCVLVYVLHLQDYPEKLDRLVHKFSSENQSEVFCYIQSWSQEDLKPKIVPSSSLTSLSIDSKLSKFFLHPEKSSKLAAKVLQSIENGELNTVLLLRSCLFYITQLHQHNLLTSEVLDYALEIIKKLTDNTSPPESLTAVISSFILHPVIVDGFLPSKKNTDLNFSNILIHFIGLANNVIVDKHELSDILSPCIDKFMRYLVRAMKKKSKLTNKDKILSFLEAFSLTADDIQLLLDKLIDTQERSYIQENWIDIESLLLKECEKKSILLSENIFSFISSQVANYHEGTNDLCTNFLRYIERFPHFLEYISDDEFQAILKAITYNSGECHILELAQFLVSRKESFASYIFKEKELLNTPSVFFPLLSKISTKHFEMKKVSKILSKKVSQIHEAVLSQHLWLLENVSFLTTLITEFMDCESKSSLYTSFKSDWEKVPKIHSTLLIVKSTVVGKTEAVQFVSDLFPILLEIIRNSPTEGYEWLCQIICETIKNTEKIDWSVLVDDSLWRKIVQASLKWGLKGEKGCLCSVWLIKMLKELCLSVLKENGSDQVAEIFELALSHSDSINVLLDSSELKYETVSLILSLVKLNPKVISTSHVPIFLSSYQATISKTDQSLLELLQLYEKNGASIWDWRPCLWGSTAANFYSVRSKSVQPLWKQPRMAQILNLLEEDIVENTIKRFPLLRSLQASDRLDIENGEKIYDPAFLLPLITHLLSSGAEVQHRAMITSGAFAIALASLSCFSNDTRSAGYLVVSRFHSHLSSDENDQQLWQNFINVIRAGVVELGKDSPQLPTICTTFLARSSFALSLIEHPLFSPLHNFILAKSVFRFSSVPAFLELIHSKDVKYQDHQEWILEVIRDGTRRKDDVDLLLKCFALKVLLNLYSYAYVSTSVKVLILQVISSCASVREQGLILATSYGLMPWANHIIDNADNDEISAITILLNKFSFYKPCSIHIKLILVSLAEKTVSPNDVLMLLKTLNISKILNCVNKSDIQILIDTVSNIRGSDSVRRAKYMLDHGIRYVHEITAADDIISALNKLIYDWLRME